MSCAACGRTNCCGSTYVPIVAKLEKQAAALEEDVANGEGLYTLVANINDTLRSAGIGPDKGPTDERVILLKKQKNLFERLAKRRPLCPDHSGKFHGEDNCLACRVEHLEAELAKIRKMDAKALTNWQIERAKLQTTIDELTDQLTRARLARQP